MTHDVYAVGNALVDIQARVPDQLVVDLGYPKGGMALVDDGAQQGVLDALAHADLNRCPGGSAANTVMGIADFGGKAAYAAKVGDDDLGGFYAGDIRDRGVAFDTPPLAGGQTGTSVILISPDGERTMCTNLAASATLGPDDVDEAAVKASKMVYVEGYLWTGDSTRAAAERTIELAKANGVKVAFTVSDPFLIAGFRDDFLKLVEGPVDLLFCNLEEARSLTGEDDPVDCAAAVHRHAADVALTLGGEGSLLMHGGTAIPVEGVSTDVVDTTGAGDMYAAGVLYGLTNGLDWAASGRLASFAAARVVGQMGARLAAPLTADDVTAAAEGRAS